MKNILFVRLLITQLLLAFAFPSISSATPKSVTIDWTMVDTTNVTGYKMYYSYSSDMASRVSACVTDDRNATSLTCANINITNAPIYFVISAVTANGELESASKSYTCPISTVQNFSVLP